MEPVEDGQSQRLEVCVFGFACLYICVIVFVPVKIGKVGDRILKKEISIELYHQETLRAQEVTMKVLANGFWNLRLERLRKFKYLFNKLKQNIIRKSKLNKYVSYAGH